MSQFNPSANVEALLGGVRTGEQGVHTGLALAHQRQSNMLNAARMAHYEHLDESRAHRDDLQQRKQDEKDQADHDTNEALLAIQMDGIRRHMAQQEATRYADTARTAMNFGQPLGGAMIGANSVLAPQPSQGMGPGTDEAAPPPVGTDSVLAPPPAPALQNGPGAIAEGAPTEAAPQTDEYDDLHARFAPALEVARRTGNHVNVAAVLKEYNTQHAALDKRKQNEVLNKDRTTRTEQHGTDVTSRIERRGAQNREGDARIDQGQQRIGIQQKALTDKEQAAEDKKAAKAAGAAALTRLKSGLSKSEGTEVDDYAAARDAGYVNQERSPLTPKDKPGKIDPNEAKADAQRVEGLKAKIARLQRVNAALLVHDPKGNKPDTKASDDALAAAESELENEHVAQAGKYAAREGPQTKEPAPAYAPPSDAEYEAFKAKTPGLTVEQRAAEWKKQHAGG